MSEQLPFVARVNIPDTVRGAELEIGFVSRDPDVPPQQTNRAFNHFVVAAQTGMFSGESIAPTQSIFRIDSEQRRGAQIWYRCTVRGIDSGAFRILLNVASEICRRGESLAEVTVSGAGGGRDSGLKEILGSRYPGTAKLVPFAVRLSDFYFEDREPIIRMEFRRRLIEKEFEQIRTAVDAWDHIVMLGGFLDLLNRDGDILPEPGEYYLVEPLVIEHLLYAFQGPPETFSPIINMCARVHELGCQLTAVEIE